LLAALVAGHAHGQDVESVKPPAVEVGSEVLVRVTWVENMQELAQRARATGAVVPRNGARAFTVLKRNVQTGQMICEITAVRPRMWDDTNMDALGHELMHCYGYDHR
jgi:hypothetical protein